MDWGSCVVGPEQIATLKCIPIVFANLILGLLTFSGGVAVVFTILSAYKYIMSGGDRKKLDDAKRSLTFSIIGLIIILLAMFLVNFFSAILGYSFSLDVFK